METPNSVVKEWISTIPYKMQAVLLLSLRGCDGTLKEDPSKMITRALRSVLFHPAVKNFNDGGMFMSVNIAVLQNSLEKFADNLDHYPNHFVTHLLHAMEIVGYKHPDIKVAEFWLNAYRNCCRGMHLNHEHEYQLNSRLTGDFGP